MNLRSYRDRVAYRARQGIGALLPRIPDERDAILAATLSSDQQEAFRRLPSADQAHLLRTYHTVLRKSPEGSTDLLEAALLHDIGKWSPEGHVRIVHRVLRVGLGKYMPGLWRKLATPPASGWRTGLVLAEHHPALGAEFAALLGCSERTCWLIAEHGRKRVPNDIDDLRALMLADHEAR